MRYRMVIAGALAAIALTGCGVQKAQKSYHDAFRESFKTSFVRSCVGNRNPRIAAKYCACADAKIEAAFTDDQLLALQTGDPRVQKIFRDCALSSIRGGRAKNAR